MRVYIHHLHTNFEVLRPYRLNFERYGTFRGSACDPDLLTLKLVRNVACVMGYPPGNFGDTMTICVRFMGQHGSGWSCDLVTVLDL